MESDLVKQISSHFEEYELGGKLVREYIEKHGTGIPSK
jgi:hypothetical protein